MCTLMDDSSGNLPIHNLLINNNQLVINCHPKGKNSVLCELVSDSALCLYIVPSVSQWTSSTNQEHCVTAPKLVTICLSTCAK